MSWELTFLHWLEGFRGGALETFLTVFTSLGDSGILWIAISLAFFIPKKTRRAGLTALLAIVFGALMTNVVLKHLFMRPRPFIADVSLLPLVGTSDMNSFPSGHTTAAFAAAVAWFLAFPKQWRARCFGFVIAAIMGFSRMYVGMHYPTDVLAGALIGSLAGILAQAASKRVEEWRNEASGRAHS